MRTDILYNVIHTLDIEDFIGVPDSTLKSFTDYLNTNLGHCNHFVPVNEGAAVALATGIYLSTKKISCVYMQNSGLGNAINPIASLINEKVYDIPMLFVIGYRGEPGKKDEPQHVFQGAITIPLLDVLNISHAIIDENTSELELHEIMISAKHNLDSNKQYAIIIKKGSLENSTKSDYRNKFTLNREEAIRSILMNTSDTDIIVSTTGKISREVYEECDSLFGNHNKTFLTVGSMGHASSIALGIAKKQPDRNIICIDGDGAALMHMGTMAFIAEQHCDNLTHIVLNNNAHESVGGMPTDCQNIDLSAIAAACGYGSSFLVTTHAELEKALLSIEGLKGTKFIEAKVSLESRSDLGRPKETTIENKEKFMSYIHN